MSSNGVHFAEDLTEEFIIEDENKEEEEDKEEEELEDDIFVNRLVGRFLEKYDHLNNFKNKPLIKNICKMAIEYIGKKDIDINYYLNFIESTIKEMRETENKNILKR